MRFKSIKINIRLSFYNFLTERGKVVQNQDRQSIESSLRSFAAGVRLNVLPDPVHFMDLRGQATYNLGFSEVTGIENYNDYKIEQDILEI